MPSESNLERLRDAGYFIKTPLPPEYEQVINDWSQEEVDALISVKAKLDLAEQHTAPHIPPYKFFIAVPH
jgi:hypothetical protein